MRGARVAIPGRVISKTREVGKKRPIDLEIRRHTETLLCSALRHPETAHHFIEDLGKDLLGDAQALLKLLSDFGTWDPDKDAKLRALHKLTQTGFRAGLLVAPVLPGITDTVSQIDLLMSEARDASAHFVHPVPLRMYSDTRKRIFPILAESYPELAARYQTNYENGQNVSEAYCKALRKRFRAMGQQYGIHDTGMERDYTKPSESSPTQLTLWKP